MSETTTPKPRCLEQVIDAMLVDIPAHELQLRARLNSLKESVPYTPPEVMGNMLHKALAVLDTHIGEPTEPWQVKVAETFRGPQ